MWNANSIDRDLTQVQVAEFIFYDNNRYVKSEYMTLG